MPGNKIIEYTVCQEIRLLEFYFLFGYEKK
jgi:hypothetical protein